MRWREGGHPGPTVQGAFWKVHLVFGPCMLDINAGYVFVVAFVCYFVTVSVILSKTAKSVVSVSVQFEFYLSYVS